MAELLLVFCAGLAGSMHCIGMCGGFACGLGADGRGRGATLRRHLIYNAGRVSSYCFLGAVSGQLGWLLAGPGSEGHWAGALQAGLALLSGALMLLVGLRFLGALPQVHSASLGIAGPGLAGSGMVAALATLLKSPGPAAPLALGALNGLLPCPLVYAFVAQAAACGAASRGWHIMAAFGLGTFPAMLAMGLLGLWWRSGSHDKPAVVSLQPAGRYRAAPLAWRLQGVRLAGAFIVLLGAITAARGLLAPGLLHGH